MENKELTKQQTQTWLKKHEEELIRVELNLCKMSSVWETSKSNKRSKIIEQKEILSDGSLKIKKITIEGVGEKGTLLTIKKHFRTFLALIKIYEDSGKLDEVTFGIHQLAEILDLSWGRSTYRFLVEALEDLRKVPLTFENIFYNKKTGETEEFVDCFTWLEDLKIYGKLKNGQPNLALSSFKLNKYIRRNILNNYTKPLFLTTITNFKTEIAILLYNHLDLVMADKDHYERNLKNLIEMDFRLDGNYPYAGDRKKLFNKPIKELQGVKLSTGILSDIHLEKTKDGKDYKIVCRKSLPVITIQEKRKICLPTTTTNQELFNYFHAQLNSDKETYRQPVKKELDQVQSLLSQYGEEKVKYIIDYAVKEAEKTKFNIKYFGAVLGYVDEAVNDFEQEKAYREKQQILKQKQEKKEKIRAKYEAYWEKQVEDFKTGLAPDELKELYLQTEKKLHEEYPISINWAKETIQQTIESNFKRCLITQEKIKILSFEDWRNESKY